MEENFTIEDDLKDMTMEQIAKELAHMRDRAERVRRRLGMNMTFHSPSEIGKPEKKSAD